MERTTTPEHRGGIAGISLGGIIVIIGIVLMFVWSIIGGLIVVLIGLIAFGGVCSRPLVLSNLTAASQGRRRHRLHDVIPWVVPRGALHRRESLTYAAQSPAGGP